MFGHGCCLVRQISRRRRRGLLAGVGIPIGSPGFDGAPAPAKGPPTDRRRHTLRIDDRVAGTTNNVVHWATAISWGVGRRRFVRCLVSER